MEGDEPVIPTRPSESIEAVAPQRRRVDPLKDSDVYDNVARGEELTSLEKFFRRLATQKKPIGGFLIGFGTLISAVAGFYPRQWLISVTAVINLAGGLLVGGGSASIRSDQYDTEKNALLKQRGIM